MGDTKNLYSKEAAAKIKALADAADICIFTTELSKRPLSARPMSTSAVDEEGNLWFLSKKSSAKNEEINLDDEVQLFYCNKAKMEFLSVYGKASILEDEQKAKELWSAFAKTWFTEGADDPELSIIKIEPIEAYYWDTKHSKAVALVKIITGAVIGKTMDDGVEGKINL